MNPRCIDCLSHKEDRDVALPRLVGDERGVRDLAPLAEQCKVCNLLIFIIGRFTWCTCTYASTYVPTNHPGSELCEALERLPIAVPQWPAIPWTTRGCGCPTEGGRSRSTRWSWWRTRWVGRCLGAWSGPAEGMSFLQQHEEQELNWKFMFDILRPWKILYCPKILLCLLHLFYCFDATYA